MSPAFLFDLDGTIIDRTRSLREHLPVQYARYAVSSREAHEDYLRRFLELDMNGYGDKAHLYETLCTEFDLRVGPDELLQDFRENCFKQAYLFPGVPELLRELSLRKFPLAIVSNGSAQAQNAKIESTGIRSYFSAVVISGEVGFRKPDRAIFDFTAETLRVSADECIFVGDSPQKDIAGASQAGMRTIWISHGHPWPEGQCPFPTYVIERISAMLSLEEGPRSWSEAT